MNKKRKRCGVKRKYPPLDPITNKKRCTWCEQLRDGDEFATAKGSIDGKHSNCDTCRWLLKAVNNARLKFKLVEHRGGVCVDCGLVSTLGNSYLFDFHHIDPSNKKFRISQNITNANFEKHKKESEKCDLLCALCHRDRHNELFKLNRGYIHADDPYTIEFLRGNQK